VLHRDGATVDTVRLRYHAPEVGVEVAAAQGADIAPAAGRHSELELRLKTPFAGAAPGQTAVLSSNGAVVGHGVIA
jgi:tRNA U34 2-thiouridine synthase MnmA/TrmU